MSMRGFLLSMTFIFCGDVHYSRVYATTPEQTPNGAPASTPASAPVIIPININQVLAGISLVSVCLPTVRRCWRALKIIILRQQKVGVVTIEGTITQSTKTVKQLRAFFQDATIKAIVLRINSGGGAPGASQAIYHTISELKKVYQKPVVAWVENIAASGAYYIATAADLIVASPSALVGSIGVISSGLQFESFLKRYDIEPEMTTAGRYKGARNTFSRMTPEQKQMIQDFCNGTYNRFVSDMEASRDQLKERPREEWADGRVFDADRGVELGLVDYTGSQLTVEAVIKEVTGKTADIAWIYPPKPTAPSLLASLMGVGQSSDDDDEVNGPAYISAIVDSIYVQVSQRLEEAAQFRAQLVA